MLIVAERTGACGVTVREVALGDLVTLAMTGGMTDPGGVLLALPYLMGDPGVRAIFTAQLRLWQEIKDDDGAIIAMHGNNQIIGTGYIK